MGSAGEFTRAEIMSQPQVWAESLNLLNAGELARVYHSGDFSSVIFTGCGSTYYLALSAAAIFQGLTGAPARGLPASEVWLNPEGVFPAKGRPLLVAISRSGETTESVRAVDAFKSAARGLVMSITCYPGSALAKGSDFSVVLPPAQEESIAQTRAFSSLLLASTAFATAAAGRDDLWSSLARLPEVCDRLLANYATLARDLGADPAFDRFYFLGSGPRYGLASEISLKMKEMSLSHSEPFHFMEFRHGPMSMVTDTSLIVGLVSGRQEGHETAVLSEMQALGARTVSLGETAADITFTSGLDEAIRDALYLPVAQLMAFEHAVSKGLNPDQPHNLSAVVRLNQSP